jgi:hypothetical protein
MQVKLNNEEDGSMSKRRRLAALSILILALPLILAASALAAPNLLGTWNGAAPVITLTGCSTEAVTMTISTQCTNLFSGTVSVGGVLVPVVGRFYSDTDLSLSGYLMNYTTYTYDLVSLSGVYVAGAPPRITVNSFTHTTDNLEDMNKEYDTFSLIKQTQ